MFESYLHLIYLVTTIFGVGVMLLDLLGVFAHSFGVSHSDSNSQSQTPEDISQMDHNLAHQSDHQANHQSDHQTNNHNSHNHHIPLLSVLRYIRMFVYFCAGFGPMGLLAEFSGSGLLGALAWSMLGGLASTSMGLFFFRLQQKDLDSTVHMEDLFLGKAEVIVPITNGNMGKVRIITGQSVAERYALAENPLDSFSKDSEVDIVRVTDECVYVRPASNDFPISRMSQRKKTPQLQK
ncbi:MAG: hypothetical protein HY819_16460 [Acidobacteria bacterium]|nr:hypothetical protein [Acidobacteriota bacterium]